MPDDVPAGSPRCQAPVVAVSVPSGLVVQPVAVSKLSEKTVVTGGGGVPLLTNSSRFGEPVPAPVTTPVVESATSRSRTWAGVKLGFADSTNAAAPATCGVAIDVPLMVFVAVLDVDQADVMLEPGAKMSRQVPKFENDERASVCVVEPTVIAAADAGGRGVARVGVGVAGRDRVADAGADRVGRPRCRSRCWRRRRGSCSPRPA